MKRKYFLRGLGVGLVVAALLLCISYRKEMTDASIIHKAKSLGMEFPGDGSAKDKSAASASKPAVSATATPSVAPSPGSTPEATETPKTTPKTTANPQSNQDYYSLTVKGGMDSSSVSKALEVARLVSSAKKFDLYLNQNGFSEKIVTGTHKIPKGASFSEIAKIITK